MQKGSIVIPSPKLLKETPEMIEKHHFIFEPCIPTKDSIYVCTSDIYIPRKLPCIEVDSLKVYCRGQIIHLNTNLFVEVQPPLAVNIEELIKEEELCQS